MLFWNSVRENLSGSMAGAALILCVALSVVFLFSEHRSYFYWDYDWVSSQNMAIAANLSADHGFVGFIAQTVDKGGERGYYFYNRFPIGTYAAIKLAMMPFGGDLSAQIFAAKTLTVCFFCAAAVTAWLALCRLLTDRWAAGAAVLLAFSSYPMLYHVDMVGEGFADMFGVMLAFHGMMVFLQERRFRQLAIKTCIALALGWHTVALVAPFVLFGLAGEAGRLLRAARDAKSSRSYFPSFRRIAGNGYVRYGALSFGVFAILVCFNFSQEYFAEEGEKAITELSSFESMVRRAFTNEQHPRTRIEQIAWALDESITRVDRMAYPYAFLGKPAGEALNVVPGAPIGGRSAAFVALAACLVGLVSIARWRRIMPAGAALGTVGFFWAIITPFTIWHPFEAMFLVGVLLVGWSAVLFGLRRLMGIRATAAVAALAAVVFGISCFGIRERDADPDRHAGTDRGFGATRAVGHDAESVMFLAALPSDFDAVREKMPRGATVWIDASGLGDLRTEALGAYFAADFYLSGYVLTNDPEARRRVDFLLTRERVEGPALLTPENQQWFLYTRSLYEG